MTTATVQTLLARAMTDADFRELLFSDPDEVLAGHDLTAAELATLKNLPRAEFDKALNGTLEERLSFGWSN
jgi:hypothetical protein